MRSTVVLIIFVLSLSSRASAEQTFFIADSWVSGFTYGFFGNKEQRFKNAWKRANRTAANDVKIWAGLFASDRSKKFGGRGWETLSRFTWQLPQTAIGLTYAHFENTLGGNVDSVRYFHGSTVLIGRHGLFYDIGGPAVTLSNYIVGNGSLRASADNYILQHEYGHYLQSQATGIAYFGRIAIPNIRSEHGDYQKLYKSHDYHPTEQDANRRAFLYMNRRIDQFRDDSSYSASPSLLNQGWDFVRNPLFQCGVPVNAARRPFDYVNYSNPGHVASLEKLRVKAKWYDYVFPIVSGFYNSYRYNNPKHDRKEPANKQDDTLVGSL